MKIGILGGGQLGRMFLQSATNYPCTVSVLDPASNAPAAVLADHFVQGDFNDEQTVLDFARDLDIIGIEIEHVSVSALRKLKEQGKRVIPEPRVLEMIQDKGLQKKFYAERDIPTPDFYLIKQRSELNLERIPLPFVQKARTGGYDGKGVQIIRDEADLDKVWDVPSVIEVLCPIDKEVAVFVATDGAGDVICYPVVEMVFDQALNLVDLVKAPAVIEDYQRERIMALAEDMVLAMATPGVFAIEMFIDTNGEVWVNETAPRVHNSAHLTIEACPSSQFDQMWRVLANQPLGAAQLYQHAAMVNLIGAPDQQGTAVMPHLGDLLDIDGVAVHWYGKAETRPGRKMGHVTALASSDEALMRKVEKIKSYTEVRADD